MITNQEIVLKLYAAFVGEASALRNRCEFGLVRSMMSADFIAHLVGMPAPLHREAFIQFGLEFWTAFPDG